MTAHRLINRRMAIAEMGKAGLAIMVLGTAACTDDGGGTTTTPAGSPTGAPNHHHHRSAHVHIDIGRFEHQRRCDQHHEPDHDRLSAGEPRFRLRLHPL